MVNCIASLMPAYGFRLWPSGSMVNLPDVLPAAILSEFCYSTTVAEITKVVYRSLGRSIYALDGYNAEITRILLCQLSSLETSGALPATRYVWA